MSKSVSVSVSILIPIYNGVEYIDDAVRSVLDQTYPHWELLIGVNGHPKESDVYRIAKTYEALDTRIRVFDFHTIRGKSNALNELVTRHCAYEFVALLDVDDIWHCTKLEIQVPLLSKYDVVGSKCVYFGEIHDVVPDIPTRDISSFDFTRLNPIINSSCIVKKEWCHWNAHWDGVEDYDLWLRLRAQGKRMYNCPEILVRHRIHASSAFNRQGNHRKAKELLSSFHVHSS